MRHALQVFFLAFVLSGGSVAAQSCYEAAVVSPSPFLGNDGEVVKLDDGSLWEVKYEYEYMYEYNPDVIVCPGKGKLIVNGKQLNVVALMARRRALPAAGAEARAPRPAPTAAPLRQGGIVESQIDDEFNGWEGETIFKLANGQIWQQSSYAYLYHYAYRPKVLILPVASGHELRVEGVSGGIRVTRLK